MPEKKKKKNIVFIIMSLFFLVYLVFYISQASGYYEIKNYNKMSITKEKMKEFEKDIENGKEININNYVKYNDKSYSNFTSKLGYNVSEFIEFIMIKGIKYTFGFVGSLFT